MNIGNLLIMSHAILTIAIPTYNRVEKLIRILRLIQDEISKLSLSADIDILVSDNSDKRFDGIHELIEQPVRYIWNENNQDWELYLPAPRIKL